MQNQTPTANLQALVPKFATRGQWFCTYPLRQKRTTINTSKVTINILKNPICSSNSRPHKLENTSQREKKSRKQEETEQPVRTSPPAILGCINFLYELYHLYMIKQRLTKKHKRKFFWTLPHNAPAMKKRPIPPRKKICGLVPEFAARWQLFRTYSLTPTSNNYMKQKPSKNST